IEDGYAVSRAWVQMKIAAGRQVRGHKIGLTSRAMQLSSQIDEPDYGTLLDDMFFTPGDIPTQRFIAPRVEVELAFVLQRRLQGADVDVELGGEAGFGEAGQGGEGGFAAAGAAVGGFGHGQAGVGDALGVDADVVAVAGESDTGAPAGAQGFEAEIVGDAPEALAADGGAAA
ncbi:MAG TPA: hypothetical protein P5137_17995, partial [Candidatus Brocadiia bacterium]|nr:hypothetical protein [Candidatus Brocadiia bacterium]